MWLIEGSGSHCRGILPNATLPPAGVEAALLKHLPPCLRELQRQEAAGRQRAWGKQDGHGFSDAHKRLEDTDPQHSGQLAQGVQEPESCSSVENTNNGVSLGSALVFSIWSHLQETPRNSFCPNSSTDYEY